MHSPSVVTATGLLVFDEELLFHVFSILSRAVIRIR